MGNYQAGFVGVRCSEEVLSLVDDVCKLYGLTRAEVMRNGAISYCQQLLITDTLQRLNQTCHTVADKCDNNKLDMKSLEDMDKLVELLCKRLGVD